jgi:hypothetical protein
MGVTYQLYNGAATVGASMPGTGLPLDFGLQLAAGTYTVLATSPSAACNIDMMDSAVVTIVSLPVISPIMGDPTVCMGDTKLLTDSTAGGVWSTDDPTVATITGSGAVSGIAFGSTTINYAVTSGGCSDSATFSIAVGNPMPAVSIIPAAATLCHGNPVNIIATSTGVAYQWETGGAPIPGATNATYSATVAGTYTLVLDNGTCTMNKPPIVVRPTPNAVVIFNTSGNYFYTGTFSSYQWLRNGTAIAGATSSIYPPTTSGLYQVAVTDVNGCTDTSAGYPYTTTAVINIAGGAGINVYPNPASSVLHIEAAMPVNVRIMSPDGRTVAAGHSVSDIDVRSLANGIYVVMIYDNNNALLKTVQFAKAD